jgi:hypothetical protein
VTTHFCFFIYKIELQSGMTISHPANSKYTSHNMYLIYQRQITMQRKLNLRNKQVLITTLESYIYLSVYSLIKTLCTPKEWLYKTLVTCDTSHIQNVYTKYGLSSSPTPTIVAIGFSCSIPSIAPQRPHRHLQYHQLKHQL